MKNEEQIDPLPNTPSPTGRLRFQRKWSGDSGVSVLQQEFQTLENDVVTFEWRDVPEVDENEREI